MPLNTALNSVQKTQFIGLLHESIKVRSHCEFLLWSQGDIQQFLPHDIMISAWGDFSLGLIYFDIVSAIPGVRTDQIHCSTLVPLLKRLFNYWNNKSRAPFIFKMDADLFKENEFGCNKLNSHFKDMRSALIHGIKDVRGQHDCLYVLLSASATMPDTSPTMLEAFLPYIDSSLRQLDHLPEQSQSAVSAEVLTEPLSPRELEIMEWVQNGKTNFEIGMILDISAFTVKNHLQRIFRKLDVMNRAQAVAKLGKYIEQNEPI
jgi:transcriptional regulator EpsA